MPGLVSTLLNHAYSMPSRPVQTFLQVTEQVWQPIHLSRLSTMPTCERIFIFRLLYLIATFIIQPVNVLHLADHDEFVAVRADGCRSS